MQLSLFFDKFTTNFEFRKQEIKLKKGIHPKYELTTVTCACGNTFQTRSTVDNLHLDICSNCHPFFTGKQKLIDSAGRVEKFMRKYKKVESTA